MNLKNYENLSKVFFKQPNNYEEMYKKRINSESCYKYDFHIGEYPAFIIINREILCLVDAILEINKSFEKYFDKIGPFVLTKIANKFLINEIKITNEIEGVRSSKKEIRDIINNKVEEKNQRFEGLVNKYLLLLKNESNLNLTNCQQVRELYDEIVLPEIKASQGDLPDGVIFRKEGVDVLAKSGSGKVIHQGIFPESKLIFAMDKALDILNDKEMSSLINIAVFHYLFGYIHPFYDGNGRIARFIVSSYLVKSLEPIVGVSISYTIKENIDTYYSIFKETNDPRNRGDLTFFVIKFLYLIEDSLLNIMTYIIESDEKRFFYFKKLDEKIKNVLRQYEIEIIKFLLDVTLFSWRGVTISEISQYIKLSESTVRNAVKNIRYMLRIKKDGRVNLHSINLEFLDIL